MNLSWLQRKSQTASAPPFRNPDVLPSFQKFEGYARAVYEKEELFNLPSYLEREKTCILNYIHSIGLKLELLSQRVEDFEGVFSYLAKRYTEEIAREISAFDLYRFVEYGYGLLLKEESGKVVGTIFELFYSSPVPSSFTIRLSVDES